MLLQLDMHIVVMESTTKQVAVGKTAQWHSNWQREKELKTKRTDRNKPKQETQVECASGKF